MVSPERVVFHLCRYFGSEGLSVAPSRLAVTNLELGPSPQDVAPGWQFTERTQIEVLGPIRPVPNLVVLFAEPVELPRVRWSGRLFRVGRRIHRGDELLGRAVDGVFLHVPHPGAAVEALVGAGVEVTDTPVGWLGQRRNRDGRPVRELLTPSAYLKKLGRVWAGLILAVTVAIGLSVAPDGVLNLSSLPFLAVSAYLRFRWDRLKANYEQTNRRAGTRPHRGWPLLVSSLQTAFRSDR